MKTRKPIQATKQIDISVKDRGKRILEKIFQDMEDATQLKIRDIINSGGGMPELKEYIAMCINIAKNIPFMVETIEHGIVYDKKESYHKPLTTFESLI